MFKHCFKTVSNYIFRKKLIFPSIKTHTFYRSSIRNLPKIQTEKVRLYNSSYETTKLILALNVLKWLGFVDDDEEKESELIMTLKRAVLCTNREQYEKAEQMLHLALRLAQQQQNEQGVLYCYDLMANLALQRYELDKAEKLFINVLQILLGNGTDQNDIKIIHISLKLARIAQLKADIERADLGYNWCIDTIKKHEKTDVDAQKLHGVIQDWYAQFLLDQGKVKEALECLKKAYEICREIEGKDNEQSMLLLNDLGTTSFRAGDMINARKYLEAAIDIGRKIDDQTLLGVIKANLGLILLETGIVKEAEKNCKEAFRLGRKYEHTESVEQAKYCIDQIMMLNTQQKN